MKEFMSLGSRHDGGELARGTAQITPLQFRAGMAHMIKALGNRKCEHRNALISEIEGGGWQMNCSDCDIRATADDATAWGLGWVRPA